MDEFVGFQKMVYPYLLERSALVNMFFITHQHNYCTCFILILPLWTNKEIFISISADQGWASGSEDHFVAQALFDFQGQGTEELSFKAGCNINIAPKGN